MVTGRRRAPVIDPYTYPGTDILVNKLDIRDAAELARVEADLTTLRIAELIGKPQHAVFNRDHLRAVHRHIFQDLYAWAGELRTVDIRKETSFFFARPQFIVGALDDTFAALARERYLAGQNLDAFAARAAYYLGEINAIHPFREGNGRAQREFIRELGHARGFAIAWSQARPENIVETSVASFGGDPRPLADLLRRITTLA